MDTNQVIVLGVAVYLLLMLAIGVWAVRRAENSESFIVAGRRMPLLICAATIMATWFGGGSMMGAAGAAYDGGLLAVIADPFGAALALFLVGFLFVRIFRRLRLLTVIDFFERRFGRRAALVAAVGSIISGIGWTGGLLVAFGFVFQKLTGIPVELGIWGGATIVFIYTTVGGMWAVAVTDFVQMVIIVAGLVLLFVLVLRHVGGWEAIAPQLPDGTFRMIPLEQTAGAWLDYLRMWFIFGLADCSAQSLLQRAFSARNEQVAQNAFYLAGCGYLVIGLIAVLLGIIASVTMPGMTDPESVIPALALEHLPPLAIALFVGALLAAIMSSADSSLLAAASIFSTNLMPYLRPGASDREHLLYTRLAIPAFGLLALYAALEVQAVYELILDANSMVLSCVAAPFIAGIWWPRANRTGVLAAMTAGFFTWIGARWLVPELPGDMLGFLACVVVLFVVTPLTQRYDPPRPLVDLDGAPVPYADRLGILPLFRRAS